jgi:hypothetical protein
MMAWGGGSDHHLGLVFGVETGFEGWSQSVSWMGPHVERRGGERKGRTGNITITCRLGVAEEHLGVGRIEHWVWHVGCGK